MLKQMLWDRVELQQIAKTDSGEVVSLMQVANLNLDSGYGTLELLIHPMHVHALDPTFSEFVDRAFRDYPIRKLCLSAVEDELVVPACLQAMARLAGRLARHERRNDSVYVDVAFYEIWREDWQSRDTISAAAGLSED
jgi:hypothetical protein